MKRWQFNHKRYLQKADGNFNALRRRRILKARLRADCIARRADFAKEWADFERWERSERGLTAACLVVFVICLCSFI